MASTRQLYEQKILTMQDISYHGTGDVYASTFLGAYLSNNDLLKSTKIAAKFVVKAIENTLDDPNHNYSVKFEPLLVDFIKENR